MTVEGLTHDGKLHPIQEGFRQEHGLQCGFCTPGMLMSVAGAAGKESRPHGRGDPLGNFRQLVPLHRLSEHREGGPARGRQNAAEGVPA